MKTALRIQILALTLFLPAISASALEFDTIVIESADTYGVVIAWSTDTESNGEIRYGRSPATATMFSLVLDQSKVHKTPIIGLLEGEDYVFSVKANGAGQQIKTGWLGFRTLGIPAPKIIDVNLLTRTKQGGTIVWKSNIPVKGIFECGEDTSYAVRKAENRYSTLHEVGVSRFNPRRRIHYRVQAKDARGREAPEWLGEFMTEEDNIAVGSAVTGTFIHNPEPTYIKDTPPILSRVTDGGLNYFTGMATSGDPGQESQWIEVDLGKLQFIGQVLTYWWQLAYPQKFTVKASMNREIWHTLGDTFDASIGGPMRSGSGDPLWEHSIPVGGRIYRYIRVEVDKGAPFHKRFPKFNYLGLFELKVYPPEPGKP